jgi:hypothetical protein
MGSGINIRFPDIMPLLFPTAVDAFNFVGKNANLNIGWKLVCKMSASESGP